MYSTGNKNRLRSYDNVIEGSQVKILNEKREIPISIAVLIGILLFLQIFTLGFCFVAQQSSKLELLIVSDKITERAEKIAEKATREILQNIDRNASPNASPN